MLVFLFSNVTQTGWYVENDKEGYTCVQGNRLKPQEILVLTDTFISTPI